MSVSQVEVILLFPFVCSCLLFQEVVIVHKKEEMQFSDFDWEGGFEETFIDFCVNPLAGADVSGERQGSTTGGSVGTWQVNSCFPSRSSLGGGV